MFKNIDGTKVIKGGLIMVAFILIAAAISLLSTSSFTEETKLQLSRGSNSFTRKSTSGSADPLSEGLYVAPSNRPIIAVQKPLVDLSIAPMKREIPPMSLGRTAMHRGR